MDERGYGCLMLSCNFKLWDKCLNIIPDYMLYDNGDNDYGRETYPHVTILNGFDKKTTDVNIIKKYIQELNKPINYDIVSLSTFEIPQCSVIKLDVESKELIELNKFFKEKFNYTNQELEGIYNPHITISYIKKEFIDELPKYYKFKKKYSSKSSDFIYNDLVKKTAMKSIK
jgi:2'-5' RNA ligase